MNKYEYLLDNYLQQGVVNVVLPVTRVGRTFEWLNVFLRLIRFRIWLAINALNYKDFNIVYSYDTIKSEDTVFVFFHDNFGSTPVCCDSERYIEMVCRAKCSFLVHLNHYVYNVVRGSLICSNVNKLSFVAETNLYKHSSFFTEQFSWYHKDVLVLPFCVQDRFCVKPEVNRKLKAVATGAVTFRLNEAAFLEHFGTDLLQPQRKYLLDHGSEITNLDLSTSEYGNFEGKGLFRTLLHKSKKGLFGWISKNFIDQTHLIDFYDLDLVDHYNSYSLVVCPSELIGLPGIGAFEAMACGAVLVDDGNNFYKDYGLRKNEHYISYDGTIDDLQLKLAWLHENKDYIERLRVQSIQVVNQTMRKKSCIASFEFYLTNS